MLIKFRRIMTSGHFLPEIDGLRFIAIFLVLTSHTWGNWVPYSGDIYDRVDLAWYERLMEDLLFQGKLGVFLFFALSGFILAQPWFVKGTVNLKQFYIRRLTRLEPPYLIAMTGYFVFLCGLDRLDPIADLPHLLASLTYTHNIIFDAPSVIYMAAWSLEVEFQFYLLSPLIFSQLIKLSPTTRISVLLAGITLFASIPAFFPDLPDTLPSYFHYFLTGILIADLRLNRAWMFKFKLKRLDLLAVVGFTLLLFTMPKLDTSWPGQLVYCAAISLIVFSGFTGQIFNHFLRLPLIVTIGGMCYSIYLLHARLMTAAYVFIMQGWEFTGIYLIDPLLVSAIVIPVVIFLCGCYFLLIERPTMDPLWPAKAWRYIRLAVRK